MDQLNRRPSDNLDRASRHYPPARQRLDPGEIERQLAEIEQTIALTKELLARSRAVLDRVTLPQGDRPPARPAPGRQR